MTGSNGVDTRNETETTPSFQADQKVPSPAFTPTNTIPTKGINVPWFNRTKRGWCEHALKNHKRDTGNFPLQWPPKKAVRNTFQFQQFLECYVDNLHSMDIFVLNQTDTKN